MSQYRLLTNNGKRALSADKGIVLTSGSTAGDCYVTSDGGFRLEWCGCPEMIGPFSAVQAVCNDVQICCPGTYNPPVAPARSPNGLPLCLGLTQFGVGVACVGVTPSALYANLGTDSCGLLYYYYPYEGTDYFCEFPPCMQPGQWNSAAPKAYQAAGDFEGYYNAEITKIDHVDTYQISVGWTYYNFTGAYVTQSSRIIFYANFTWDFNSVITVENAITEGNCGSEYISTVIFSDEEGLTQGYGGSITLTPKCTSESCDTPTPCEVVAPNSPCGPTYSCLQCGSQCLSTNNTITVSWNFTPPTFHPSTCTSYINDLHTLCSGSFSWNFGTNCDPVFSLPSGGQCRIYYGGPGGTNIIQVSSGNGTQISWHFSTLCDSSTSTTATVSGGDVLSSVNGGCTPSSTTLSGTYAFSGLASSCCWDTALGTCVQGASTCTHVNCGTMAITPVLDAKPLKPRTAKQQETLDRINARRLATGEKKPCGCTGNKG